MAEKTEYKSKLDEIEDLIARGRSDEGIMMLEAMNFRKVKNVNTILRAADILDRAKHYEEEHELLSIAHERSPIGRMIIFKLASCEVALKDLDSAKAHYEEFTKIAPHDDMRYILRYRINKASGADDNTLIGILEELKSRDFTEEWAYELARLYHRTGQADKCIDICDDIILWFGEGPFVQRALELKMLYTPLDRVQAEKYRRMKQSRDAVTEIMPEDTDSSQFLPKPVAISKVEVPSGKLDTVNLQAEIKRNIEEIMEATEAGAVTANMEEIRSIAKDFPFLSVNDETREDRKREQDKLKADREKIDKSLKSSFQNYLIEENDGQMTLNLPDNGTPERQVEGQLTIDDIMKGWHKTSRAAGKALAEADKQQLENDKQRAIEEANELIDKLSEAAPKIESGATPQELMEEEMMNLPPAEEEPKQESPDTEKEEKDTEEKPSEAKEEKKSFHLQNTAALPVITEEETRVFGKKKEKQKTLEGKKLKEWRPPVISKDEAYHQPQITNKADAVKVVEDVNAMLQRDIDAFGNETESAIVKYSRKEPSKTQILSAAVLAARTAASEVSLHEDIQEDIEEDIREDIENDIQEEEAPEPQDDSISQNPMRKRDETTILAEALTKPKQEEEEEDASKTKGMPDMDRTIDLAAVSPDIETDENEEQTEEEEIPEPDINEGYSDDAFTDQEKELFTYFTPISGMEQALAHLLRGVRARYGEGGNTDRGNVVIVGGSGSGKTTLAMAIVKVMQREIGRPNEKIGKIDAKRLNSKDIQKVLELVQGGVLIIEKAGALKRETATSLSLLMHNDTSGTLVIMEDNREGMKKALSLDGYFSKMFSERVSIPVMTIDELVNFGQAYSKDLGYVIDEMGVLALYDRINRIQTLDHPTYITAIKEIVDEAIDKAEHGSFFTRVAGKRFDPSGNRVLQEKHFVKQ